MFRGNWFSNFSKEGWEVQEDKIVNWYKMQVKLDVWKYLASKSSLWRMEQVATVGCNVVSVNNLKGNLDHFHRREMRDLYKLW